MKVTFSKETKEDFDKHRDYLRRTTKSDGYKYQKFEIDYKRIENTFFEKLLKEINWNFCIKLCGVIGIYKKRGVVTTS